ncbi:hypothetical protein L7F22_024315 [Adiantum nelumboides]|nr:hypothetical protein [Adiantum nelumboides]
MVPAVEVSMTISMGGGDIDVSLLACMDEFLKSETCAGISRARGGGGGGGYIQFVFPDGCQAVNDVTGFCQQEGEGLFGLCLREITSCAIAMPSLDTAQHSHILRDGKLMLEGLYQPHFCKVEHSISVDDINEGIDLHSLYQSGRFEEQSVLDLDKYL